MNQPSGRIILCGNVNAPPNAENPIRLSFYDLGDTEANILFSLDRFVANPENLSSKVMDLLEISAYVFSADRATYRGSRYSLSYDGWARSLQFHIPVREYSFWANSSVTSALSGALSFMTGDRRYEFVFYQYNHEGLPKKPHQLLIFNDEYVDLDEPAKTEVMLFSGGLDSLAGAIEHLRNNSDKRVCLVSHQANTATAHTQNELVKVLQRDYENRVRHCRFECHFKNFTSRNEDQRTRMFLYSSIAFAICNCYGKHSFYVYENGITGMNLSKQADVTNGRASRTTHPKTIGLLQSFFRLIDDTFAIHTPYFTKTKRDVLEVFRKENRLDLLSSSVSCSSMRQHRGQTTHCGWCSQCVERRFAIYAAGLEEFADTYSENFITDIRNNETYQRLYSALRMAAMEGIRFEADFREKYINDLVDIIDYLPGNNPDEKAEFIYQMYCRNGDSILSAAKRMQTKFEDLAAVNPPNSLLAMLSNREHLKSPTFKRVCEIDAILRKTIPLMFQRQAPKGENDFNDKIEAVFGVDQQKFEREYPLMRFGITAFTPDHSRDTLLIESKYIRKGTPPSVATAGIAEDITKAPAGCGLLFIVYDPGRAIKNDESYIESFESRRESCYVRIYR